LFWFLMTFKADGTVTLLDFFAVVLIVVEKAQNDIESRSLFR
jgi:hypothetical protein